MLSNLLFRLFGYETRGLLLEQLGRLKVAQSGYHEGLQNARNDVAITSQKYERAQRRIERLENHIMTLEAPVTDLTLVAIKFTANVLGRDFLTEFTLGLGPCGKTVTSFNIQYKDDLVIIRQVHSDGTFKLFTYKRYDIIGRIQECYEKVTHPAKSFEARKAREAADIRNRKPIQHPISIDRMV